MRTIVKRWLLLLPKVRFFDVAYLLVLFLVAHRRVPRPAMDRADFQRLLQQRIDTLDVEQARADVRPFLRDARALEIRPPRCFLDLAGKVAYA